VVSVVALVGGVAATLVSHDPRFVLVKDSLVTGVFGAMFLGSLVVGRPLAFVLGREFMTGGDPSKVAEWDARWTHPRFRAEYRRMSVRWGVGLLIEAGVRVALSFARPPALMLVVSPILVYGTLGVLAGFSLYRRRALTRALQAEAQH
jgi:hypothetical protein